MRTVPALLVALILGLTLTACNREEPQAANPGAHAGVRRVTLQLNWKPEPQFGGFYTAKERGAYAAQGLDVDVVAGGVGTPTVQMVGTGKVDFAVVSADELIIARERGNNVVALFAVYQTCPQGLMVRASRGFTDIGDIFENPGTVAMQRGLPYSDFLERKFGFANVNIVPSPGGDLSVFLSNENFAQQCFITSEPIAARRAGVEPQTFLIADAGYNPYTTVLVTREQFLKENPELVRKMVDAVREGWRAYLDNPAATNQAMNKLNPSMDPQTFADAAEAQKPLIETVDDQPLGAMTAERWSTLAEQLKSLGVIEAAPPAEACFHDLR